MFREALKNKQKPDQKSDQQLTKVQKKSSQKPKKTTEKKEVIVLSTEQEIMNQQLEFQDTLRQKYIYGVEEPRKITDLDERLIDRIVARVKLELMNEANQKGKKFDEHKGFDEFLLWVAQLDVSKFPNEKAVIKRVQVHGRNTFVDEAAKLFVMYLREKGLNV